MQKRASPQKEEGGAFFHESIDFFRTLCYTNIVLYRTIKRKETKP